MVRSRLGPNPVSERRICRVLGQSRSLPTSIQTMATTPQSCRLARRLLTTIRSLHGGSPSSLRENARPVYRLSGRTASFSFQLQQGQLLRHRATHRNHVWGYDFLTDRTEDGRQLKLLVVIDEFTRECLTTEVGRTFTARDVMLTLQYLFAVRGAPEHIRSDNGPEFIAKELQRWLDRASVRTLDIQKASPWENGYVESFNGKLRDELLNRELFLSVPEARFVLDEWRLEYNHRRPHSGLNWQTPAAYAAALDDRQAGVFPAASRVASPVGATPLPPTPHAY